MRISLRLLLEEDEGWSVGSCTSGMHRVTAGDRGGVACPHSFVKNMSLLSSSSSSLPSLPWLRFFSPTSPYNILSFLHLLLAPPHQKDRTIPIPRAPKVASVKLFPLVCAVKKKTTSMHLAVDVFHGFYFDAAPLCAPACACIPRGDTKLFLFFKPDPLRVQFLFAFSQAHERGLVRVVGTHA